jgi:hypothetical protein
MYSIFGRLPIAAKTALAKSFQLRASPVPLSQDAFNSVVRGGALLGYKAICASWGPKGKGQTEAY